MSDGNHWRRIGLLLILAILVQGWGIARNAVPAQDAINFLQFARQLDRHSVVDTLRSNSQHPLYPLLVWLNHRLFGGILGPDGIGWLRSAQMVAAMAAVLLVVPMYRAGVRLANPSLATGATALFTMLPFAARMGADALSDSTYLFFMLLGFWTTTEFLLSHRAHWLTATGLSVGLAYLARPEALFLPAALMLTLVVVQWRRDWRMPSRQLWAGAGCGAAGLLLIVAPYALSVGKLTPKGSLNLLPGGRTLFAKFDSNQGRPQTRTLSDGQMVAAPTAKTPLIPAHDATLDFARNHRPDHDRLVGYSAAFGELVRELVEGMHYLLGLLVLVGVFFADRKPANLLTSILALIFLAVLVQFASKSGYIASRHVITLVCLGCYVAARGGWVVAGAVAKQWTQWRGVAGEAASAIAQIVDRRQRLLAAGVLCAAAAFCLPRSLAPLHRSREAHVNAGHWLAEHATADSIVLDSRGWASLYSGLPAYNYDGARLAFEDPRLAYVIVENVELIDERPRGDTLRHLLGIAGHKIAEFPTPGVPGESVEIFAWHPERLAESARAARPTMRAN